MRRTIIDDKHRPRPQVTRNSTDDVGLKGQTIHRTENRQGRNRAASTQRIDPRYILPSFSRTIPDRTLAFQSMGVQSNHH